MSQSMKRTLLIAVIASSFLVLLVILQHNLAFQKTGTIVLPAGGTYLGSTPKPESSPTVAKEPAKGNMVTIKGRLYPYAFEAPSDLTFVTFPDDTYDIYALSINNQPPEQNVMIGVDDLNRTESLKGYIKANKRAYVENWWKQFSGLKGISSIGAFTNKKGLSGYRVKFINASGQTPNEDIFLSSPDGRYVIHMANGPLPKNIFDAIVDSVSWNK